MLETADHKPKRKHRPPFPRRYKIVLLGLIIFSLVSAFYPLIWLTPPLLHLTPYFYIAIALLWIPLLIRNRKRYRLDKVVVVLLIGCLLATYLVGLMFEYKIVPDWNVHCEQYTADSVLITYDCVISTDVCNFDDYFGVELELVSINYLPISFAIDRNTLGQPLMYCLF